MVLDSGLWTTSGRTPYNSVGRVLALEPREHPKPPLFKRVARGRYVACEPESFDQAA